MRVESLYELKNGRAKLRMLLVGVDYYQAPQLVPLSYAVSDCRELAEALTRATQGFPEATIDVYYGSADTEPLQQETIHQGLDRLLTSVESKDTVLIYFSGHGVVDEATQKLYLCLTATQLDDLANTAWDVQTMLKRLQTSGAGKQVMIIDSCYSGNVGAQSRGGTALLQPRSIVQTPIPDPADFAPKMQETLRDYASQATAENRHFHARLQTSGAGKQVMIIDSCYSGNVGAQSRGGTALLQPRSIVQTPIPDPADFAPKMQETLRDYASQATAENRHFHALLSCDVQQLSWELADLGHGIFTYHLIQGIEGGAADPRGHITIDKLYDYVFEHTELSARKSGKVQTPRHIKAAAQQIVIGVSDRFSATDDGLLSSGSNALFFREEQYRKNVLRALEDSYPLDPNLHQKLRALADKLFLFSTEVARIESETIQRFERLLESYKQRAIRVLHSGYPHHTDPFVQLQQNVGLRSHILKPLENQAYALFEEHSQRYKAAFAKALYQQPEIDGSIRQQLRQLQTELDLNDAAIADFETTIREQFEQDRQTYRTAYSDAIHHQRTPDVTPLRDLQQRLELGDAVVEAIQTEAMAVCWDRQQQYRQAFANAIHQQLTPDLATLRQDGEGSGLGIALLEAIEAEENERCTQDKQQYQQQFAAAIRQQEHLSNSTQYALLQVQQSLGFSSTVAEALEEIEVTACEHDKGVYRQQFEVAIHQEHPLSQLTQSKLDQLQERLGLGDELVRSLQQEATEGFEKNKQRYLLELGICIRQHYPIGPRDRQRLSELQHRLGLANEIIDSLTSEAIALIDRDKATYQQHFDSAIRSSYPLTEAQRLELDARHRELNLNDALVETIERELTDALERHRQDYCDAVVTAIHEHFPITPEARERLQHLQQDFRFSDTLIAEIEAQAIAAHQSRQENLQAYTQEFERILHQYNLLESEKISVSDRAHLEQCRIRYGLSQSDTANLENQRIETYQIVLQRYKATLFQTLQRYPPDATLLDPVPIPPEINSEIACIIRAQVTQKYELAVEQYIQEFNASLYSTGSISAPTRQRLQQIQHKLNLDDSVITAIEHQETQTFEAKVQEYERKLQEILEKRQQSDS
ncbi:caspase family protein [Leptothermofonsia sichuanensis E412]|uniref:caspase family protein n=1 Tax=Leptothermofonsia sichuanensis TaxID=2917832 RepID=UPI001CA72A33|nr:caspase family protein [Leptothermofonsia sichuanensis]QZZ21609.1 caspase family protein [Leptothermofonsia sichuanensis E412]